MSEQAKQLARVSDKIAGHIVQFVTNVGAGGQFHMQDLVDHVIAQMGADQVAPDSSSRILRNLRTEGLINYKVKSRKDSLYQVLALGEKVSKKPEPTVDPDEAKRYRAFLTRLTKWVAWEEGNSHKLKQFSIDLVRRRLIREGEVETFLDDGWRKRAFGDDKLFSEDSGGFCWIVEDADPPKKPTWKGGVRPGENILGNTLSRLLSGIARYDEPPWQDHRLAHEKWEPIHQLCVQALAHMTSRGLEKPLVPFCEFVFAEAAKSDDRGVQTIALWFTNTRYYTDAYSRVRAHARGEEDQLFWPNELRMFRAYEAPLRRLDDGTFEVAETEHTAEDAVKVIRGILANRGLLRRRAA